MEINRLPVWIISRVERATVHIKLVREHQCPLIAWVHVGFLGICALGCMKVDEAPISGNGRDLSSCVYPAQIEPSLICELLGEEM